MGDRMHIELVALCHTPIVGRAGAENRAALTDAMSAGADLVGGCSYREPEVDEVLDILFGLAESLGCNIDLHVDETLEQGVLTLPTIAERVMATGFGGSVGASHCVSLGMQTEAVQRSTAAKVANAGIGIATLPQTNLFLQGRQHQQAMPRALTSLVALSEAGVNVCGGADNVQDPFNPVGRSDPLETAALLVMAGHRSPATALEMVSSAVRTYMGLPAAGLDVGCQADLIAIDAMGVRQAIADAPSSRKTFREGRLVASTEVLRR